MNDVVILTDHRYENPKTIDWYIQQVLTEDNLSAAYGMYIYHVDAPNIGEKIGKLAIVK